MNEQKTAQALLIIDMQNDFVHPGTPVHVAGAAATVPVIRKLRESCRKHEIPVFHVIRSYSADGLTVERTRLADFRRTPFVVPGTLGAEIIKELTPEAGEKTVIKPRYSAFFQTSLDLMLKRLGVERVLVSGSSTRTASAQPSTTRFRWTMRSASSPTPAAQRPKPSPRRIFSTCATSARSALPSPNGKADSAERQPRTRITRALRGGKVRASPQTASPVQKSSRAPGGGRAYIRPESLQLK